jgi:hypothetical protein
MEPITMPPQHGVWLDEHQRRSPAMPKVGQEDPECPVTALEARTPDGALQGFQLLPQRDVFEDQFLMPAAGQRQRSRHQ